MSLAHHVANQDPLAVGTKTMDLFVHSLKDCMPHLICHPACLLTGVRLSILGWSAWVWLNSMERNHAEPCLDWPSKCFRRVSDGGTSKGPDSRAPSRVSDGFPTGFRRVSDGFPTGFRWECFRLPVGFRWVSGWFPTRFQTGFLWGSAFQPRLMKSYVLHVIELPKY